MKIENIKKENNELVIYPSKEKYDSSKGALVCVFLLEARQKNVIGLSARIL